MSESHLFAAPAIVRHQHAELVELDARVDQAEDTGIRSRWEFGRALLRKRIGKLLPPGLLDELAELTGKSRTELKYRARFAERFATEEQLGNAVAQYGSWHAIVNDALATPSNPLLSSESDEWYTPAEYVDRARAVLGAIDLDPASCETAQQTVRAAEFFDEDYDGLAVIWHGRVFLNPPYGRKCTKFVEKLRDEYDAGNVTEAVLLVSAYSTETEWFQPLFAYPICFPDHRLRGWPNPTFGSAFVYFGSRPDRFADVFGDLGPITRPWSDR